MSLAAIAAGVTVAGPWTGTAGVSEIGLNPILPSRCPVEAVSTVGDAREAEVLRGIAQRLFPRDASGRVDAMLDRRDNNDLGWRRVR